jgi:hypothetical protein
MRKTKMTDSPVPPARGRAESPPFDPEGNPEDAKLVTLAKASRARIRASQGAAIRDTDGRTYAAASVVLASLNLSALQAAVAMAVSSGARSLEAAVVLGEHPGDSDGVAAVSELAPSVSVYFIR